MVIEEALMTYLLADTTITAYVGERIFYAHVDWQDVETPYLVVTKISGVREHSHDGSSHLAHPRFQIAIFSTSYSSCKSIAAVIQTALQGYSGTMSSGVDVGAIFYENETDLYDSETSLFQVITDYIIWHTE